MMDWDNVRYFLAVARKGSVRAAAEQLKVTHSTVLRRIAQLEDQLGAQVFEKLPSGYRLTVAGEDVLDLAEEMDGSSNRFQARIFGRDQAVRGTLRVTLPPVLASHLLMRDFADFARLFPDVEIEILSIDEPVNLTNREADVAIRNVYDRAALPDNLYGLKGPDVWWSVYIARDLLADWHACRLRQVRWVLRDRYGHPDWCREIDLAVAQAPFRTTDAAAQIEAVRRGLGVTLLPCFVGDSEALLVRVPGAAVKMHGTLWLLSLGTTRKTKRVRLFTDFISQRLAEHAPLISGSFPALIDPVGHVPQPADGA